MFEIDCKKLIIYTRILKRLVMASARRYIYRGNCFLVVENDFLPFLLVLVFPTLRDFPRFSEEGKRDIFGTIPNVSKFFLRSFRI